jgi:hypothetical protein
MIACYAEGGGNGGFPKFKPKRQVFEEANCSGGGVRKSQAVLID